jgi:hypothetical protein
MPPEFCPIFPILLHGPIPRRSTGTTVSEPDHLSTKEIEDNPLWTIGFPKEVCCLGSYISALNSASSAFKRTSNVIKL